MLGNLAGGSYYPKDIIDKSAEEALREDLDTIGRDFDNAIKSVII